MSVMILTALVVNVKHPFIKSFAKTIKSYKSAAADVRLSKVRAKRPNQTS